MLIHRYYDTQQRFLLRIDFSSATTQILATADLPSPSTQPPDVYFGRGIVGRVDELQAADYAPGPEANFDYDPANCGKNIPAGWCLEDVATASPPFSQTFLTWPLPARYKIVYNPGACTSGNKCKVVFALSGGGPCADNYMEVGDFYLNMIVEHVPPPGRSSLAVVTVDPICWAWGFEPYPDEILQFLAVKAHIASFHNDLFNVSGDYYATGCSHGAIQVIKWAADAPPAEFVSDHPKRTFVRSAGDTTGAHPDCEYHETWCGEKQELFDFAHFGRDVGDVEGCNDFPQPWEHSHDVPCMDTYIDSLAKFIDLVNPSLVMAREIGRSWGVNLPIGDDNCGPGSPSEILCPEEGGFAATDGGRQFRQQWMAVEEPLNRTGFFIENDHVDCGHCKLTPFQLECVVKYLEGGRVRLEGELGQPCLAWEQPAEPAKSCTGYPR